MIAPPRVGILGGTLDPIHRGHVEAALAARAALALDRLLIVPARIPPHRRQPFASAYHRFAMAALAAQELDDVAVSDVELCAEGPSYTADTLARLAATGLRPSQIFFISGADAFAEIETWSRFPEVLDLAHFAVVSRPGQTLAGVRERLPALADRMVAGAAAPPVGERTAIFLLDARTPDVSSSEIRRRIAGGEPLTGLVAASVESHIVRHGLYRSASPLAPERGSHSTADHLHG